MSRACQGGLAEIDSSRLDRHVANALDADTYGGRAGA
jgi:hypothetical protein